MPWKIGTRKGKYCVFKEGTTTPLKCYSSKTQAEKYLKALYASEAQNMSINQFYFVQLSKSSIGKPIDGLAVGEFTDMNGRRIKFEESKIPGILAGTLSAIEATRGESGELAGLPIDMKNHEHGDAAGWIIDAEQQGKNLIRLGVKWTQSGIDLISNELQRFFSPSVDLQNLAIVGGSLTNWPATRAGGKTLLRPIELSEGIYTLQMDDTQKAAIADAFTQANPPAEDGTGFMVADVVDGAVIVSNDSGDLIKCAYTEKDGAYTFAPAAEWVKVEVDYKEVSGDQPAPDAAPAEAQPANASLPIETIATVANMSEAQIAALVDERVNERMIELARKADRKRDTLAFSERICNGTKETPIGLSVPPADLCEILLAMPDDAEKKIRTLLEHVVSVGVVNFSERGHSQIIETKPELPAELKKHVKTWLDAGKPLAEFFVKVEGVGKMEDYNLSEYQGAK